MKLELDLLRDSEQTFDALLDEINKQKKLISQLQSEIRSHKTNEIRLNKTTESTKTENIFFQQENATLIQKVRELEIQLTLPTDERTFAISRAVDPFPKKKAYQLFNWSYIIIPIVAIGAIFIGKWWAENEAAQASAAVKASIANLVGTTIPTTHAAAQPKSNSTIPLEEGYVVIENPLEANGMVRVMEGFYQNARVLAWINGNEKYKIRAQSPQKMRRTYIKDGKNITFEDYFYKISEKDQWVFGYFTNRRLSSQ